MKLIFRLIAVSRRTTALVFLCVSLAISTAGLAVKATLLSAQVATLTAKAASSAVRNRRAATRIRAKARLRRLVTAIPLAGIGAAIYFERQDFQGWQEENPDRNLGDYSCEVAGISAEVVDEVLQELPELIRPGRDFVLSQLDYVLSQLSECTEHATDQSDVISE